MGPQAINYTAITAIVTSWVTSPLLGGAISFIVFSVIFNPDGLKHLMVMMACQLI
jgi:phosphate/sulfate permease